MIGLLANAAAADLAELLGGLLERTTTPAVLLGATALATTLLAAADLGWLGTLGKSAAGGLLCKNAVGLFTALALTDVALFCLNAAAAAMLLRPAACRALVGSTANVLFVLAGALALPGLDEHTVP